MVRLKAGAAGGHWARDAREFTARMLFDVQRMTAMGTLSRCFARVCAVLIGHTAPRRVAWTSKREALHTLSISGEQESPRTWIADVTLCERARNGIR